MLGTVIGIDKKPHGAIQHGAECLDTFRRWGYLQADLDPLGRLPPQPHRELDSFGSEAGSDAATARHWYCGTLGVEFMHIPDPDRREWISQKMERVPAQADQPAILEMLIRSTLFEQVLQSRYIGNKRFSLEGLEALIPLLNEALHSAADAGASAVVLAMSHRGRLNVMAHVVGVDSAKLFAGFEDLEPRSIMGAGDVKYHLGATGSFLSRTGRELSIHLVSNPSHLEAVNPVALGRVRAKQSRLGDAAGKLVIPILLHGDAALAGQGITAETFNLAQVPGFSVGGTYHVVVNNLIGFTAEPRALHSSRFASDVAKRLAIPIFHVNGEDPDAVVRAARLAMAYRFEFSSDVVIDLIGYRRHGHSEIDDPTITQPLLYRKIKGRSSLWAIYSKSIEADPATIAALHAELKREFEAASARAGDLGKIPLLRTMPKYWSGFFGGKRDSEDEVDTGLAPAAISSLTERLTSWPEDFRIHPKVQKMMRQRVEMGSGNRPIDFGMAEALALASLLQDGIPVRFSGQDSRRGTFSHRHSVLIDFETGEEHCPLSQLSESQGRFEIYDSVLSEAAVLGYEYGYSRDYPEALVLWEAQFGDFANGAQVIFDQFVTAGEDKWGLLSGLVVLLPHGFEGQGPEHSSARVERFLQLAAEDAIQVVQPSTAAQLFHLLRRQALRRWRKPLIVFTPKSMLRQPAAASSIGDLGRKRFANVLLEDQVDADAATRILLCSGKIGHELRARRAQQGIDTTAVISLEQLYPFPAEELEPELARFPKAREIIWVQEEPANMGALFFIVPRIQQLTQGRHVRSVKRSASGSPATGSAKAHQIEQNTLLTMALG
ncbi:MAG: 2-oxoglutarate dehydrogenase E1 component [Thermoanaerobaculia bacterium]